MKIILKLLTDAHRKDIENTIWQQWLVDYSNMDEDNFTSFEDYKKKILVIPENANKIENTFEIDKDKILADAEKIKVMDQKGGK